MKKAMLTLAVILAITTTTASAQQTTTTTTTPTITHQTLELRSASVFGVVHVKTATSEREIRDVARCLLMDQWIIIVLHSGKQIIFPTGAVESVENQ